MLKHFPAFILTTLILFSCSGTPVKKKISKTPKKKKILQLKLINYLKTGRLLKRATVLNSSNALIAVSDIPGTISIYSLPALSLKKTLPAGPGAVIGIAFNRDGSKLTAAYAGDTLRTYSVTGLSIKPTLIRKGKYGQLRCLAGHPRSGRIALGNGRGEVLVFNGDEKEPLRKKTKLEKVNYIRFSPDGKTIVISGRQKMETLKSSSLKNDEDIRTDSPVISLAFSSNSKFLAAGTLFWQVLLLETSSLDREGNYSINMDPVSSLAFFDSKKWLISGSGKTGRGTLHFFTYPRMKLIKKKKLDMEEIFHIESMDKKILIVSSDGTIQLLQPIY